MAENVRCCGAVGKAHGFGNVTPPRHHPVPGHADRAGPGKRALRLRAFASSDGSGHRQDPVSSATPASLSGLAASQTASVRQPLADDAFEPSPAPALASQGGPWMSCTGNWDEWQATIAETYELAEAERRASESMAASVELQAFKAAASLRDQLRVIRGRDRLATALAQLELAIAEERYDDAARLRDQAWSGLPGWWVGCSGAGAETRGHLVEIRRRFGHYAAHAFTGADVALAMGWGPVDPGVGAAPPALGFDPDAPPPALHDPQGFVPDGTVTPSSGGALQSAQSVMEMHFRQRGDELEGQAVAILGPASPTADEGALEPDDVEVEAPQGPASARQVHRELVEALERLLEVHAGLEGAQESGAAGDQGAPGASEAAALAGSSEASSASADVPSDQASDEASSSPLLRHFHEMVRLLDRLQPGSRAAGAAPSRELAAEARTRPARPAFAQLPRVPARLEWVGRDAFTVTVTPRDADEAISAWRAQHGNAPADASAAQEVPERDDSASAAAGVVDLLASPEAPATSADVRRIEAALRTGSAVEQVLRAVSGELRGAQQTEGDGAEQSSDADDAETGACNAKKPKEGGTDAEVRAILRTALAVVKAKRLRDARALRSLRGAEAAPGEEEQQPPAGALGREPQASVSSSADDLVPPSSSWSGDDAPDAPPAPAGPDRLRLVRAVHHRTDPFTGMFLGQFGPHGPELLQLRRVAREGETWVEAVKVTGDANVPAGEPSFEARVDRAARLPAPPAPRLGGAGSGYPPDLGVKARYPARGRVAEPGYRNAKWVDAELLEFVPGNPITRGAELGVVFNLSQAHRFLILFNKVDLDGLRDRLDALTGAAAL